MAKPLSGRPLFATAADADLYVPLPDIEQRLQRSIQRGLNTLILGERGSGKTTLVQQLLLRHRDADQEPPAVYIDGSVARTVIDLIELLREGVGAPAHLGETVVQNLQIAMSPTTPDVRDSRKLLARLQTLRELEPAIVILDGLTDAEVVHDFFGRLRDELWQLPFTWLVTADSSLRSGFLTPPADAFFETTITLGEWTVEQQIDLLRRRLGDDFSRGSQLLSIEGGNPRRLLAAAREAIVDERPIEDVLRAAVTRQQRAAAIGRSASMMLAKLENLDRPVAASDDELLQRLGVTRERATQVLRQLDDAGLLESFHEAAARGRPRKLYRLRDVLDDDQDDRA